MAVFGQAAGDGGSGVVVLFLYVALDGRVVGARVWVCGEDFEGVALDAVGDHVCESFDVADGEVAAAAVPVVLARA
jgi:hypothetical protein